jgi:hypothetical protein
MARRLLTDCSLALVTPTEETVSKQSAEEAPSPVACAAYRFQRDLEQLASGSGPISRKVQIIRSGNRRHRFSFGKVGREIGEDEAAMAQRVSTVALARFRYLRN